ncbi:hypothetical protein [Hungatella hathewayi]|uniref:hypothetical protein n=1 Tax=Hungatella hathewayi TaxID=154046 RepID=UPI003566A749
MSTIKLFSGMDFSGKSTTINNLDRNMRGVFRCQQKFLTPIQTLQRMIDNNIWIPRDEFIPLLQEMVMTDIKNYRDSGLILQDTLWVIKFTSKLLVDGQNSFRNEIENLLNLIKCYPDMDSFYISTTMEERRKRYEMRVLSGERISRSDKLLFSGNMFEEVEKNYKNIIFERFPNTQIIDSTNKSTDQIVRELKGNRLFFRDIH